MAERGPKGRKPMRRGRTAGRMTDRQLHASLAGKSPDKLASLLVTIAKDDPMVRALLVDACAIETGRFGILAAEARAEIRDLTSIRAWRNSWTGEGEQPDYRGLEARLETLLKHGEADAVIELGRELASRGLVQVEQSHDEGETADALACCLAVVARAVRKSTLSDEDQLFLAIDLWLEDDYGICDAFGPLTEGRWRPSVWSSVADRLSVRLDAPEFDPKRDPDVRYRRGRVGEWVVTALDRAGRHEEAIAVSVGEARVVGRFVPAVARLIGLGADEQAAALAEEAFQLGDELGAGDRWELQDLLVALAGMRGDTLVPAALAAARFFASPSVAEYRFLLQAASRTPHLEVVRTAAVAFLESGRRPDSASWPLPAAPGATAGDHSARDRPRLDVLVRLAVEDGRPDDALKWFDRREATLKAAGRERHPFEYGEQALVAKAVEATHPERAIEIHRTLAEVVANQREPKSYPKAGEHLDKVRSLLHGSGRGDEWPSVIGEFRETHKRKRRLVEVLDRLENA